jgi:hypothetical protein
MGENEGVTPAAGAGDATSAATRYLCVAAYVDEEFNDRVVRELFGQAHRAVAPSYGFDVGLVSLHCLAARRRRRRRDVLLTAVGTMACLLGSLPTVAIGLFWWSIGRRVDSFLRQRGGASWEAPPRSHWIVWPALLLATAWYVLVVRLLSNAMSPFDAVIVALVVGAAVAVVSWLVLYMMMLGHLVGRRRLVFRELRSQPFHARPRRRVPMARRLRDRLDAITWGQLGNVTVYGRYDPFVGAGIKLRGWNFTTALTAAPDHEGPVERFSVAELVEHVRARIAEVAAADDGASGGDQMSDSLIPGLVVSDQVFVSGAEIDHDARFFTKRATPPRTLLSSEDVERVACAPHGVVRHYSSVQVRSWDGEVVTFTLFHFSAAGGKLHFQCVRHVLPPIDDDYHVVDRMSGRPPVKELFGMLGEAAARTASTVAGAPVRLVRDFVLDRWPDRLPADSVIDYGARIAVRELGADDRFHNYFQYVDNEKNLKFVARTVLFAVCEFLDDHGVDTAELKRQQTSIVNMGIMQIGKDLTIGAAALGSDASAVNEGDINIDSPGTGESKGDG